MNVGKDEIMNRITGNMEILMKDVQVRTRVVALLYRYYCCTSSVLDLTSMAE